MHTISNLRKGALSRKVSDEFTVPLCRTHHRELHQRGDERIWWVQLNLNPLLIAERLWKDTHSSAIPLPANGARRQMVRE